MTDKNIKMEALKRKLKEDKQVAYDKRIRLEEEKKEKKRFRERLRYHSYKTKIQVSNTLTCTTTNENNQFHNKNSSPETEKQDDRQKVRPVKRKANTNDLIDSNTKRKKLKVTSKGKSSIGNKRTYEREKKRKQRAKIYADPNLHSKFLEDQKN